MKDVRSLLDEADPLRREPELSDSDRARIRSAVVSAAGRSVQPSPFWSGAFALAAAIVLTVIAGTMSERTVRLRPVDVADGPSESAAAVSAERRQVQFATPGGTRVIWTLDPEFQLREVER
jgi:hypothetical protein